MAQTQGGAVNWNVTQFYVVETAPGAVAPAEILPLGTSFDVRVDFDGSGAAWTALEMTAAPYTVKFYAESIGLAATEIDLGTVPGNLGVGPYTASLTVGTGIPNEGVYRLGCLIEIVPGSGVVGFDEGLVISVASGA